MSGPADRRSALPGGMAQPTRKEIETLLKRYILDEFLPGQDPAELTESTPLITGGILDSLSALQLVGFIEEHFGFQVEAYEADVDHLNSIAQIADLVQAKL